MASATRHLTRAHSVPLLTAVMCTCQLCRNIHCTKERTLLCHEAIEFRNDKPCKFQKGPPHTWKPWYCSEACWLAVEKEKRRQEFNRKVAMPRVQPRKANTMPVSQRAKTPATRPVARPVAQPQRKEESGGCVIVSMLHDALPSQTLIFISFEVVITDSVGVCTELSLAMEVLQGK